MTTNPAPANDLLTEVRELLAQPGPVQDQAEAVNRLRDLEAIKGMLEAEQALVTASFEKLRLEHEASQKVPKAQRGKGLAAEIALARSESPARGKHHLELAQALCQDMHHTLAALSQGRIREEHAQVVVKETSELSSRHRQKVDRALQDRLGVAGPRELANEARAHAQRLDPKNAAERTRKATDDRRVTSQPLADGVAKLIAFGPSRIIDGIIAKLRSTAKTQIAAGKATDKHGTIRTRDQIMFDTLSQWCTGSSDGSSIPIETLLVMTPDTLFAQGDTPAWLAGHGPIPAAVVREWLADQDMQVFLRRVFTAPQTQQVIGLESTARAFPSGLRKMALVRDRACRTPFCEAPIVDTDHMVPYRNGGPTSWDNASGLCAWCNQSKENRDWRHDGDAQTLRVITPTGHTYTKHAGPVVPGNDPDPPKQQPPDDDDPDSQQSRLRFDSSSRRRRRYPAVSQYITAPPPIQHRDGAGTKAA